MARKLIHQSKKEHSSPFSAGATALQAALDDIVLDSLRPTFLVLIVLLLVLGIGYVQAPPAVAGPSVAVTVVVIATLSILSVLLHREKIAPRYANAVGTAAGLLLAAQRLIFIALSADPMPTANLILTVVGAGFILLSTRLFIGLTAVILLAWGGIAFAALAQTTSSSAWMEYGFALVSAVALSCVLHFVRLRSLRRQTRLRFENEARRLELERRALQLETLIDTGGSITAILDLNTLLAQVVDLVQVRFGYDYVGIFRVDETGEALVACAGTGAAGPEYGTVCIKKWWI